VSAAGRASRPAVLGAGSPRPPGHVRPGMPWAGVP